MASIRYRSGKWQARLIRKGYPPVTKTFAKKSDADKWSRQHESEMDTARYVSQVEAERTTLGELIDRYIIEVSPTKRGCKDEIIRLKAMKRHSIAHLSMASLTSKAVAHYRDERLSVCKPSTVIRDLASLSSLINHSRREWGIAITNPVAQIRKPSAPNGRERILSSEEEARLMEGLEPTGRKSPYMKPLCLLALETAMRRGELLALRWTDINWSQRSVYLKMTKNGESRTVPLSIRALAILKEMPRSIDGKIFKITIAALEAAFHRACIRSKIENFRFHDLRHMATTRLSEKLSNVLELSAVTGHKELRMLKRYYHPRMEDLVRKLD